jgi:uncharacterized ferredoxin-like protein
MAGNMNRENVLKIARACNMKLIGIDDCVTLTMLTERLEEFARMVEEAERQRWEPALMRAADAMRRCDPAWCAAHEVEQINDVDWDDALAMVEDAVDDCREATA